MPSSETYSRRLMKLPEVKRRTGLSRSTIYNYIAADRSRGPANSVLAASAG